MAQVFTARKRGDLGDGRAAQGSMNIVVEMCAFQDPEAWPRRVLDITSILIGARRTQHIPPIPITGVLNGSMIWIQIGQVVDQLA